MPKRHFACAQCQRSCTDSFKFNYTISHYCERCRCVSRFTQVQRDCPNPMCEEKVAAYASQQPGANPLLWSKNNRKTGTYWAR